MISLLPFNYLNSQLENARQELQNAAAHLELLLLKSARQADPAPRACSHYGTTVTSMR